MKLRQLRKELYTLFKENDIESPETDSGLILMHVLGIDKTALLLNDNEISAKDLGAITEAANRRIKGEPIRYLIGRCPFMDLEFFVNKSTLIPRPDTEILIEEVSRLTADEGALTLWDIGCGSGCIGITLAHLKQNLTVYEIDISAEALKTAHKTAYRYALDTRVHFVNHDILSGMPPLPTPDIIVSNPPYIPSRDIAGLRREVKDFEPHSALDGGSDGLLFYKSICQNAVLKKGGILAFEIGYDQGESVPRIMHDCGYYDVYVKKDLSKNPRVVIGRKQ